MKHHTALQKLLPFTCKSYPSVSTDVTCRGVQVLTDFSFSFEANEIGEPDVSHTVERKTLSIYSVNIQVQDSVNNYF